jgi:glycosyltransferase involved in cell wall biosynthesis
MSGALAQIVSAYGVRQAVSLVHFPRWEPLVLRARNKFGWKILYDCLDDQRAFAALYQTQLRQHETQLIHEADSLITSSAVLQQRLLKGRPNILMHNAADYQLFSSSVSAGHLRHLPRPIAGFFGAFADWLDVELIRTAARQLPDWSFVYIGAPSFSRPEAEARWLECTGGANITVLPQMDPCTLAPFLAEFDVCTMPFLDVPVTQTMNPVKIYEYLAAGKPVVSRDLPEVRHASDLISLYSTPEEFVSQLRSAVASDNPDRVRQRQNFAQLHDWSARVDALASEIARIGA